MATRQKKEERYYELIEQGLSSTEALAQVDMEMGEGYSRGKIVGASSAFTEPKGKKERVLWKGEKVQEHEEEDIEEDEDEEEELPSEKDEYLKTREKLVHGLRKTKEVVKGVTGFGSRRPVGEALISGAAKAITLLKGKPKTPKEIREEEEEKKRIKIYRQKEEHVRRLAEARSAGRTISSRPQLRDIGRGDMGSQKFAMSRDPIGKSVSVREPDFFGVGAFGIGTTSVRKSKKSSKRVYIQQKPPSTSIYMPSKPPSVSIGGFDVRRPPSTSIGMGKSVNPLGGVIKTTKSKSKKYTSGVLGLKGFW